MCVCVCVKSLLPSYWVCTLKGTYQLVLCQLLHFVDFYKKPSFTRKSAFHGYFLVYNPYKRLSILLVVQQARVRWARACTLIIAIALHVLYPIWSTSVKQQLRSNVAVWLWLSANPFQLLVVVCTTSATVSASVSVLQPRQPPLYQGRAVWPSQLLYWIHGGGWLERPS